MDELLAVSRRKGAWWRAAALAIFFVLAVSVLAVSRWGSETGIPAADLEFSQVTEGDLAEIVEAYGEIRPVEETEVSAPAMGVVEKLHRAPGDRVEEGDVLVSLANAELADEYQRALRGLQKARSDLDRGRAEMKVNLLKLELAAVQHSVEAEAYERLLEVGGASQVEVEKKHRLAQISERILAEAREAEQARVDALALEVKQAEAHAAWLAERMEALEVRSQKAGRLQFWSKGLRPGVRVEYGQRLASVSGEGGYKAVLKVPVRHAHRLALDMPVEIRVRRQKPVTGRIAVIHPRTENDEVILEVVLDARSGTRLYPGQSVRADILVKVHPRLAIVAPPPAVEAGGSAWVFRLDRQGRRLERVLVRFGVAGREGVSVESGLEPGDWIVTSDMSDWVDHSVIALNGDPEI